MRHHKKIYLLKKNQDKVFIKDDFISFKYCAEWVDRAPKLGPGEFSWKDRTMDVTNFRVTDRAKKFVTEELNLRVRCSQAQLQVWPEGSKSELHIHDDKGRDGIIFNSMLYLNDNFLGGEFYTKEGIIIKPRPGLFTTFNGQKIWHGVQPVTKNTRYTFIFWWQSY